MEDMRCWRESYKSFGEDTDRRHANGQAGTNKVISTCRDIEQFTLPSLLFLNIKYHPPWTP